MWRLLVQAPAPLLTDYGYGTQNKYNLDITMLTMLNSKERTLSEYVELGYVKLHRSCTSASRWHLLAVTESDADH